VRRLFLLAAIVMLVTTGCIKPRPNTRPQASPLDVPPPPPRVIVPPEPEPLPDETKTEEPDAAKDRRPTRPRPQPPRERTETAKPPETKQEPPVSEAAKPPAQPPVPLGQLQPLLPASKTEVERQVSDQLALAKKDLDRIDYRALSADAKSQYDTAKRFIAQAGDALKEGNLVFAAKLAEKAVGLASNLVPR
jgi:outer membrane biosynthesis protein TonB